MKRCKICGENLYNNITFYNMFNMNYIVHDKCIIELQFNNEEEVIPIESNILIYDYVFTVINKEFNEEYLWIKYFKILMLKYIKSKEWSMMILYDENIVEFMQNYNPYILFNLTNKPILFISLKKMNTNIFEEI